MSEETEIVIDDSELIDNANETYEAYQKEQEDDAVAES